MGEYHEAMKQFVKAKELTPATQRIDELIQEAKKALLGGRVLDRKHIFVNSDGYK